VDRPANVKDIETAIAHGDLSENSEYHAAKEKQGHISARIAQLDDKIARAQIIDTAGQIPDKVRFGATVELLDAETDDKIRYTIVGEDEADAKLGRISVTSPVAQALMNKAVGDEVSVKVPKGRRELELIRAQHGLVVEKSEDRLELGARRELRLVGRDGGDAADEHSGAEASPSAHSRRGARQGLRDPVRERLGKRHRERQLGESRELTHRGVGG